MDNPEVIAKIQYYEEQLAILETQLNDTKEHLKKIHCSIKIYFCLVNVI